MVVAKDGEERDEQSALGGVRCRLGRAADPRGRRSGLLSLKGMMRRTYDCVQHSTGSTCHRRRSA